MNLNTIYLIRLNPGDENAVRDDFRSYPFPGWRPEVLTAGMPIPPDILSGKAILVVGCGAEPPGCPETMWLLRVLSCGCPWVVVAYNADHPSRARSEAAGAASYLTHPFGPPTLRELIWRYAVPHVRGGNPSTALTCDLLFRYLTVLGASLLLKFTGQDDRAGFLGMDHGRPVNAHLPDGPSGEEGLRCLLDWGSGVVSGLPLPPDLPVNLSSQSPIWTESLIGKPRATQVAGGREACDRLADELPGLSVSAVVDLSSERVVARPTVVLSEEIPDEGFAGTIAELLRPIVAGETEWADEVFVRSREGWWAARWLNPGPFALVVANPSTSQIGYAQCAFEAAVAEFGKPGGLTVEEVVADENGSPSIGSTETDVTSQSL